MSASREFAAGARQRQRQKAQPVAVVCVGRWGEVVWWWRWRGAAHAVAGGCKGGRYGMQRGVARRACSREVCRVVPSLPAAAHCAYVRFVEGLLPGETACVACSLPNVP